MEKKMLEKILQDHKLWLNNNGGEKADLCGANLCGANLCEANLCEANLYGANLYGANLRRADLRRADLYGANLYEANLCGANLCGANLCEANLYGANLPNFQIIPQCGEFIGWKKGSDNEIIKLKIPAWARRTSCLKSRKCRAEFIIVLEITKNNKQLTECRGSYNSDIIYRVGKCIAPDSYNPDIRVDCTNGIHFFITRKEAEEY